MTRRPLPRPTVVAMLLPVLMGVAAVVACQPKGESRYQATGSANGGGGSGNATASAPASSNATGGGSAADQASGTGSETSTGEDDQADELGSSTNSGSATGTGSSTSSSDEESFAEEEGSAEIGEDDAASSFAAQRVEATKTAEALPTLEACQADGKAWLPGRPACGDALAAWCCTREGVLARFPSRAADLASRIDAAAAAGLKLFQCSTDGSATTLHFARISGQRAGWRRLRVAAPEVGGSESGGSCVLVGTLELRTP